VTLETATLLAVLATPIAVLAVVAAVAVGLISRRGRDGMSRSATMLARQEGTMREELVGARGALTRSSSAITAIRATGSRLDTDLALWTAHLTGQRQAIERLSLGGLGPAVRAMKLAGALARVALLWRTPAR